MHKGIKWAHLSPHKIPAQVIEELIAVDFWSERLVQVHLATRDAGQRAQCGNVNIAFRQHEELHTDLHICPALR